MHNLRARVDEHEHRHGRDLEKRRLYNFALRGGGGDGVDNSWGAWATWAVGGVVDTVGAVVPAGCQYKVGELCEVFRGQSEEEQAAIIGDIAKRYPTLMMAPNNKLFQKCMSGELVGLDDFDDFELSTWGVKSKLALAKEVLIDVAVQKAQYVGENCYKNSLLFYWFSGNAAAIDLSRFRAIDGLVPCEGSNKFTQALQTNLNINVDDILSAERVEGRMMEEILNSARFRTVQWAITKEVDKDEITGNRQFDFYGEYLQMKGAGKNTFFTRIMEGDKFATYLFAMIPFKIHTNVYGQFPWDSLRDKINFMISASNVHSKKTVCSSYAKFSYSIYAHLDVEPKKKKKKGIFHKFQRAAKEINEKDTADILALLQETYHTTLATTRRKKSTVVLPDAVMHGFFDEVWGAHLGETVAPFEAPKVEAYSADRRYLRGDVVDFERAWYVAVPDDDAMLSVATDPTNDSWRRLFARDWNLLLLHYWYKKSTFFDVVAHYDNSAAWYAHKSNDRNECYRTFDDDKARTTKVATTMHKFVSAIDIDVPRLLFLILKKKYTHYLDGPFSFDSLAPFCSILNQVDDHTLEKALKDSVSVYDRNGKRTLTYVKSTLVSTLGKFGVLDAGKMYESSMDVVYSMIDYYAGAALGVNIRFHPKTSGSR